MERTKTESRYLVQQLGEQFKKDNLVIIGLKLTIHRVVDSLILFQLFDKLGSFSFQINHKTKQTIIYLS